MTVDRTAGRALDGSGGTDQLANFENVTGSVFNDIITGTAAANLLEVLAGDDRLDGMAGKDRLVGGAGGDTFAFTTALGASNVDTIADLVSGTDRIELKQSIFSALDPGALAAAAFVQAAAATNAQQHIIYNSTTGVVSYDADGKGGSAAIAFARLTPGQALAASDFVVV